MTLICAKFGNDLLNICKDIGRETKWPRFFWPTLYMLHHICCRVLKTGLR